MLSEIKNIQIADFDYNLPDERIPRHPLAQRDACKLLVLGGENEISHLSFTDVERLIPADSVLVCNDTKVINARIKFRKDTGSTIEVFLLEPLSPRDYVMMFQARGECCWSCMIGNLKRWKSNPLVKNISINGMNIELKAWRGEPLQGNAHEVRFTWDDDSVTFASVIEAAGFIPIPPYLKRESEGSDKDDYQTIYAKFQGSVAAPTAGLHFTPALFDRLRNNGVKIAPVTLHVGAGTFQPVKSDEIGEHPMHTEVFTVTRDTIAQLLEAVEDNRPITAVGTTSVRTIESLPVLGLQLIAGDESLNVGQWEAYELMEGEKMTEDDIREETLVALRTLLCYLDENSFPSLTSSTSIMIAPGFRWRLVNRMITNFHQPQSTLLLLVSSFLGQKPGSDSKSGAPLWKRVYEEALSNGYRFLSYGDACFFTRR